MRPLLDCDTVQIEITNACTMQCSNCTRLVGHHPKPYFMEFDQFKAAVDSLIDYPKMVGMMGGEPLLHPEFERFCEYLGSKIPAGRCGLWSTFPKGKEHYRDIIVKTFGNIFLNDHSRTDILHGPILVASEEIDCEQWLKDYMIDKCWVQNYWSASINPRGAFFCEVAAALSMLLKEGIGWEVKPGWWKKSPKDFVEQMDTYCKHCGGAMPLNLRPSCEGVDDISPMMFKKISATSPKIKRGCYQIHDLKFSQDKKRVASYKEMQYRECIANRYGLSLALNPKGFCTPYLRPEAEGKPIKENDDAIA
jgi:hypothetical protein